MAVKGVSFIIIAYNEEFAIRRCLESISKLRMIDCEVICIDSASTDQTCAIMQEFKGKIEDYKIFKLDGYVNAAVARNVGIKNATKEFIYFIDGDVEIQAGFLLRAITLLNGNRADAVTGKLKEYQYDSDYKNIVCVLDDRFYITKTKYVYSSGGIFIAKKNVVRDVGYFNEDLGRNEDLDFTLRLTSKYKMMAVSELMGIHHTVPYHDKTRIREILSGQRFFGKVIFRNLLVNKEGVFYLLIRNKGFLIGFLWYLMFIVGLSMFGCRITIPMIVTILCLDIFYGILKKRNPTFRLLTHYLCPILIVLFTIFPLSRKGDRVTTIRQIS